MASADVQVRVIFPASGLELQTNGLRVLMAEYTHEIAIATFSGLLSPPATTGAPVYIAWGTAMASNVFVGYFDHFTSDATTSTVVCIGASYPTKDVAQNVWTDTTADQVAYEIADRYRLDVDIVPHDRIFPQIVQSGESDWQLLVRLAKSIGYSCYVRSTQLRFHPRTRDFLALQEAAPVFSAADIFGFTPVNGSALPDQNGASMTLRQLTTLDASGEIATSADLGAEPFAGSIGYSPTFTSVSQQPVDSVSDAIATLVADREMSRWYITADTVVRGDVNLRPTMPIYLGNLLAVNTGYWCVLSAEHRVVPGANPSAQRYTVKLKLGRDSQGQSIAAPSQSPALRVGDAVLPRLLNGRWTTSRISAPAVVEEPIPEFVRARLADRG